MSDIQQRLENVSNTLQTDITKANSLPDFVISQEDYDTIEEQADDLLGGSPAPIVVATPNVFVQSTEPTKKDGIWIETNDYEMSGVICDNDIFENESWNTTKMANISNIPFGTSNGEATIVGTNIYFFGCGYMISEAAASYKYDILTDTYTQLTNIPYNFYKGKLVRIGTDIYLFGSSASSGSTYYGYNAYKYDSTTGTYTKLTNIPYIFNNGGIAVIGTDIYLFGGGNSDTDKKKAYRYSILTNTYTKLANIPYNFVQGSAVSVGTNIYLFGGSSNTQKLYKYDTLTDTYTQLSDIPYTFYQGAAIAINSDIYLFGGNDNKQYTYKYDTLTDTYAQLTNIPYNFVQGSADILGDDEEVYLIGGNTNKIQILELNSADYEENQVVISQGVAKYHTKLLTNGNNIEYWFNNAWIYTEQDGLVKGLSTYYGNGTSWVKFKN